jgi:hypothetical protein
MSTKKQLTPEQEAAAKAKLATRQAKVKAEVGVLKAMGREMIKDVRSTVMEVFFNQSEKPGELGAPLNQTPQQVTEAVTEKAVDLKTDKIANIFGPGQTPQQAQQKQAEQGQQKQQERGGRG